MKDEFEFNLFKALDFIRDHAPAYAKAKAERVYLEEFRKTKKAVCMKTAMAKGFEAVTAQEREAYADPEYQKLLDGLKAAVEEEERLRWLIVAAQAKIECWRSIEASRRIEAKTL
jgi:hypothetical protein